MLHKEQLIIIQNMMLQYKEQPKADLFEQILTRLDDVMVGMVKKISVNYYFVEPNIQDMYQCAILGLYKTIAGCNTTQDPAWLLSRVYSYIRNEIYQIHGIKKLPKLDVLTDATIFPVDANLIQEEQLLHISSLIKQGIINEEDMQLLQLKFVEGMSVRKIVDTTDGKWGKTWHTVNKRIEKTLTRIRSNISEKNEL
jgi:hypothetical protein